MKKYTEQSPRNSILETTLANVTAMLDTASPQPLKPSEQTDSRLEQNILFNIHRHYASMEWLIGHIATGRVRPRTRRVLLWALAELRHLTGAPPHAVVDTATHFVKKHHAQQEAAFVNAFLRKITDAMAAGIDLLDGAPEHVRLEMPEALWKRWQKTYGKDAACAAAEILLAPSPVIFRCQLWPACDAPVPQELAAVPAPEWMPEARLFTPAGRHAAIGRLMAENRQLYIQDPATLLAPAILAPKPGETIADLCAAPGGKARLIAELMHGCGTLLCRDKAEDKLQKISDNLQAFPNADIAQGDATAPDIQRESLDAVLLDVPCTNTGVLRRKPDAKWSFDAVKLAELTDIQGKILEAAAPLVKHGGRIVYSTCSLEPEENTKRIHQFIAEHGDFSLEREIQLLPAADHDGAYAALLRKN